MSMRSSSKALHESFTAIVLAQPLLLELDGGFPRLERVLEHEEFGHVRVIERDDQLDVVRLLLRRETAVGVVEQRQQLVDGLLDVLHHVRFDLLVRKGKGYHVDNHVVFAAGDDQRLVLLVLLLQLVPLLALQILLHVVDRREHQTVLAEQLQ